VLLEQKLEKDLLYLARRQSSPHSWVASGYTLYILSYCGSMLWMFPKPAASVAMSCEVQCRNASYVVDVFATSVRIRFDGRSTAYQRSLRSQRHWPADRSHADLFIYLGLGSAADRNVGCRGVTNIPQSNYSGIVSNLNSSFVRYASPLSKIGEKHDCDGRHCENTMILVSTFHVWIYFKIWSFWITNPFVDDIY